MINYLVYPRYSSHSITYYIYGNRKRNPKDRYMLDLVKLENPCFEKH